MEDIQRLEFLAGGDVLDRLSCHRLDGKGRTSPGVAVHLGQDHPVEIQPVVECLGSLDGVLSGHRIYYEEGLGRLDCGVHGRNLVHQFLVNRKTSRSVYDYNRDAFALCLGDGATGYPDVVCDTFFCVNRYPCLGAEDLQLLYCGRPEGVAGCQKHLHSPLALDVGCKLRGESGLSRTVQSGHEHHSWLAFYVDVRRSAAHEFGELVVDDLYHHLLRFHGSEDILAHCLLLHIVAEFLGYLVAYVGVQEGASDVLNGFGDVDLGDLAFAFQYFKRPFKPFAQVLKHLFLK